MICIEHSKYVLFIRTSMESHNTSKTSHKSKHIFIMGVSVDYYINKNHKDVEFEYEITKRAREDMPDVYAQFYNMIMVNEMPCNF